MTDPRKIIEELVALEDERIRLRQLHEMGHGTDYDHYHKALPKAWAAARAFLAEPEAKPRCTCLTNQLGPDYCEVHAA